MKQKILSLFVFAVAMLISITANAKVEGFVATNPQKVQVEKFLPLQMTQLVKGQPQKMAKQNVRQPRETMVKSQKATKASNKMTRRTGAIAKRHVKTVGDTDITIGDFYTSTAFPGEYYVVMTDAASSAQFIFDIATESFELGKTYTMSDMLADYTGIGDANDFYAWTEITDATYKETKDEKGFTHVVASMTDTEGTVYNITYDQPEPQSYTITASDFAMTDYGTDMYIVLADENGNLFYFDVLYTGAFEFDKTYTLSDLDPSYSWYKLTTGSGYSYVEASIKVSKDQEGLRHVTAAAVLTNGDSYNISYDEKAFAPSGVKINVDGTNLKGQYLSDYGFYLYTAKWGDYTVQLAFDATEEKTTYTNDDFIPNYGLIYSDENDISDISLVKLASDITITNTETTKTLTGSVYAKNGDEYVLNLVYEKQSEWTEWEPFAPGGSNDAVWDLAAWAKEKSAVKCYVHTSTSDATKKQIKVTGYGAGIMTEAGVDILINWDTNTNNVRIPIQLTGYYNSSMKEDVVFGDVASIMGEKYATVYPSTYDPEQGKFSFNLLYSVPSVITTGSGFGLGVETLQMAGEFKDYTLSFSRGTVDDAATPIKQTVNVNIGKDITSYRVHVDTYENYAAAKGSAAYFEALAKAEGTDYTDPSVTVDLQGSEYNIYVVVVSAFVNGEMNKYDYDLYEVSPASDWETIGTRPYREDIVTNLYNFGITGPVYDVEVQKHKTYKDIYRIKNPYGSTSPFGSYTLYENAYLYLNAQDPTMVKPTFRWSYCDLGIDVEGGVPLDLYLADDEIGGTFDGYAISFPTRAIVSDGYYVNRNGLFRAVINFKDPVIATTDGVTSVLVKETVKITSDNKFSTPVFESLTPEIATVDSIKGVVTGIAPGVAKIRIIQDAALEYNAVDTVLEITVEKNDFVYGEFVFNTDEGLAALGIEKPEAGKATNLTDKTLTSDVVTMTTTDGGTATRVWNTNDVTDLRMYNKGGSFTFSVPEGYQIVSIDFTGTECSMFGEDGEFETCTKTHTVWNAPADTITSKTFAAAGTCKINVIKVKVAAPGDPTGINEINNFPTIDAEGIFNLRGQKVTTMRPGNVYIINGKKYIAK